MMILKNIQQEMIRIKKAFGYSTEGFKSAYKEEAAFRQELKLVLIVLPILIFIPLSLIAKTFIFISLMIILIVELLNSAIEATVDRISTEWHPLAKQAKDIGSAAVFLSLINFIVVCVVAFMI